MHSLLVNMSACLSVNEHKKQLDVYLGSLIQKRKL